MDGIRARVTQETTFHATVEGKTVPLAVPHLQAIAGIIEQKSTGLSEELRYLFQKGVLDLGLPSPPTPADLEALIPCADSAVLYLDPQMDIKVRMTAPGGVSPPLAAPMYSYFVPPVLGEAISNLAERLRLAGRAMVFNALTRNKPVVPEDWLRVFETIYRDHCSRYPLSEFVEIASDPARCFKLSFKQSLQQATCTYPEILLKIARSDDRKASIPLLLPSSSLPAISHLIRKLRCGMRGTEVVEWVAGSRDASGLYKVLTNIVRSGGLTVEAPQGINWDELLPPRAALSILHLGHAGLLIRGGQSFVAVDPWFVPSNPRYRKPPLQSNQLPTLEAVFLTHEHWDHVNEQSLLQYPNHVPIIVPRQPTDRPLQPRFREFLELFGFEQVVELGHWEHHVLSNGLVVTAVPFLGEGSADEGSVRNCYLVERAGKRVFVHVDSSLDSFNRSDLSEGVIDRLVADHGPVDVLYATRRQELHFGFECISDFYPIFLGSAATRLCGVTENCHCPASYLAGLARDTRCALMVLYSEGGAEWYPFSNFLRGADGDEQFAGYDFLWDSFEDIVRQVGVPVRLSRAMDVVIVGDVIEHVISAETQPAERSQADDED